jgi:glycosyltransferase involved in cell wall biosynthesis
VYFHENQLVYPSRDRRNEPHLAIRDLYTALAADRILFNSLFNRDSLLEGLSGFLARMPDFVPPGVLKELERRSEVLPVALEPNRFRTRDSAVTGALQILWNHRWEHDKAPDRFFDALIRLADMGVPFTVHVAGQRFREAPEAFESGRTRLGHHVGTWGFIEDPAGYQDLLGRCDVVVSTALQEFQGLSVLEAMAAGCQALVPDRLAYRETVPDADRYASWPDDAGAEVEVLADRLAALARDPAAVRVRPAPDVKRFGWAALGPRYRTMLEELVA